MLDVKLQTAQVCARVLAKSNVVIHSVRFFLLLLLQQRNGVFKLTLRLSAFSIMFDVVWPGPQTRMTGKVKKLTASLPVYPAEKGSDGYIVVWRTSAVVWMTLCRKNRYKSRNRSCLSMLAGLVVNMELGLIYYAKGTMLRYEKSDEMFEIGP